MGMKSIGEAVFLVVAGAVAGTATSAGAIASLIAYPALLVVGIPAVAANVTNAVAVVGTGIASTLASGPELQGTSRQLRRWSLFLITGAVAGAVLLLSTPDGLFTWVVPFLVAAASVLLLAQPRITLWRARRSAPGAAVLPVGLFAVGVYNGYFGAASGIMLLALLMITVESRFTRANALKNVLLGVSDVIAAGMFIAFGPIDWPSAVALGSGFLIGGAIGPALARRAPAGLLRVGISLTGLALAVVLLVVAVRTSLD
jgi:uncharacterized membrane protein YfcA